MGRFGTPVVLLPVVAACVAADSVGPLLQGCAPTVLLSQAGRGQQGSMWALDPVAQRQCGGACGGLQPDAVQVVKMELSGSQFTCGGKEKGGSRHG